MMSIKDEYKVIPIPSGQTYDWLLNKHYAKRIPSISYAFGLYDNNNDLQGVCTFGMTANNNLNEVVTDCKTVELNRLVVNEGLPKNTLSYFVAGSLNLLPQPIIIISYADSGQGHRGYIYQATNWSYTGMGKDDYEFIKGNRQYHRKMIYDLLGTGSMENATKMVMRWFRFSLNIVILKLWQTKGKKRY